MANVEMADSMTAPPLPMTLPHRRWKAHPRPGIDFPDINTVADDAAVIQRAVGALAAKLSDDIAIVAGIDLGGAALAGAVASVRGLGFVHVRKVGSLRTDIVRSVVASHDIGHGLALTKGLKIAGRRIALVDDCLLSGATALAAALLLRELGAHCDRALFAFEIEGLGGREALARAGIETHAAASVPPQEPVPA